MAEVIYYTSIESGFDAIPAENYVDYMTNVMPRLERHIFYVPSSSISIVCEVHTGDEGRELRWSLRELPVLPEGMKEIRIDKAVISRILNLLQVGDSPVTCSTCDEYLGEMLRF